jgi:hypothetical protein
VTQLVVKHKLPPQRKKDIYVDDILGTDGQASVYPGVFILHRNGEKFIVAGE